MENQLQDNIEIEKSKVRFAPDNIPERKRYGEIPKKSKDKDAPEPKDESFDLCQTFSFPAGDPNSPDNNL